MPDSPYTSDHSLEQLRHRLRVAVSFLYLLYYGFWYVIHHPVQNMLFSNPRTWLAGLALLMLAASATSPESLTRSRPVMLALSSLTFVCTLVMVHQGQRQGEALAEVFTWLNVIILLSFFSFGSLPGVALNAAAVLGLTALTITGIGGNLPFPDGVTQTQQGAGLFTALVTLALGYLTMQFIEQNLSLHEQTTGELAAAKKDALTGVLGRAAIEEELRRYIRHSQKTAAPLSLIVTDIDHFKRVNDQFGHGAGDDVLRSFAKRLRRNVGGSGGMVGRWGGEEFVILLPGVARPDALAMGERLRYEVSHSPVAGYDITASFGVASYRSAGDDVNSLFGRADERLYEAKNAGRNAVRG